MNPNEMREKKERIGKKKKGCHAPPTATLATLT
jgi:hypothetical protein